MVKWLVRWLLGRFLKGQLSKIAPGLSTNYRHLRENNPTILLFESRITRVLSSVLFVLAFPWLLISLYQFVQFGDDHIIWATFCLVLGLVFGLPGLYLRVSSIRTKRKAERLQHRPPNQPVKRTINI